MKTILNDCMAGITNFATNALGCRKQIGRPLSEQPSGVVVPVEPAESLSRENSEPAELPIIDKVMATPAIDEDPVGPVSESVPSIPIPSAPMELTEPVATPPAVNNEDLHEQFKAIRQSLEGLGNSIQAIEAELASADEGRRLLAGQETVIRDLNVRLRQAEDSQTTNAIMKPVVSGIIQLYDTVWSAKQDWAKQRPVNADEWITNVLAALDGEILAMLSRHGAELIRDTSDRLDRRKQCVVRTQIVRPVQDGTVLTPLKPGFYLNGQVLRPEEVVMAIVKQGGEQ